MCLAEIVEMCLCELVVNVCLDELLGICLGELVVKVSLVDLVGICQVSWWSRCAWLR